MANGKTKSFLQALFDLDFREFVTIRIVKLLYIIGIVLAGLLSLAVLVAGLGQGGAMVLVSIILAPLYFILSVIWIRVCLEIVIVVFRIADNTEAIAKKHKE